MTFAPACRQPFAKFGLRPEASKNATGQKTCGVPLDRTVENEISRLRPNTNQAKLSGAKQQLYEYSRFG